MPERPFAEKSNKPDESSLEKALGKTAGFYSRLDKLTTGYLKSWSWYKASGWIQKVADKKKALFYFIPFNNNFTLSMTIRESEKDTLSSTDDKADYHEIMNTAKKYHEGYNIVFEIEDEKSYEFAERFIKEIMALR